MASRSSEGMGVMVALVIFILLTVALVLTSMLMYTKKEQARRQMEEATAALQDFIRPEEANRDEFKRLLTARGRKSVVRHLVDESKAVMQRVSGKREQTLAALESRLDILGLGPGDVILDKLREGQEALTAQRIQSSTLQDSLDIANARVVDEQQRREDVEAATRQRIEGLQIDIDRIQAMADSYRQQVEDAEAAMDTRVRDIRGRYEGQIADLNSRSETDQDQIARLTDDNRVLKQRIKSVTIGTQDEGSLIDGYILNVLTRNEVFIDLGRKDHVVLGLTFEVFSDPTMIRLDSMGNRAPGKALIEITRITETASTARVIRSVPGQAVVDGDILVNDVYDPKKRYTFFVFGQFDLDNENGPSQRETESVVARIREWGGEIRDELTGDVDYLVLGRSPIKPPPLPLNPDPAQVRQWVAANRFYEEYQRYLNDARSLSIPVLNDNRIMTLLGYSNR